jgi:MFS family permease
MSVQQEARPHHLWHRHHAEGPDRVEATPWQRLWQRGIDHYPEPRARYLYLGITVVSAIVLYYEFYVQASVTPAVMAHFHMTWPFFVYAVVVGNLVGAFASLLAGLADRWGRANLVAYGLLATAAIALFGMPHAPDMWAYAVLYSALGFVEGIILVATPALIRDFSPQLGRASAMAFWTLGPVIASLTVSLVASHTLNHLSGWNSVGREFLICGIVGMVVFVIAFLWLRELTPRLRDQLMVSMKDRVLVEARAAGVDVEEGLRHPWKQMVKLDTVVSSLGIGVFLVIYYTLIAFLPVFMASIFGYSQARANLLGNWIWAFNAGALVVVGLISDRARVRKPFMVLGAVVAAVATAIFAVITTRADTGYYEFVTVLSILAIGLGFTFSTWLAAYTETVEDRNPALAATGLAIWGWVLRIVVGASLFILPFVVTSMTALVEHGTQVQAIVAAHPAEVQALSAIDPATVATLNVNPTDGAAIAKATSEISTALHVSPATALQKLLAVSKVPKAELAYLGQYGNSVQRAKTVAPKEWQHWWWGSFAAELLFIPSIFLLRGRWSPKRAKNDAEEHEAMIQAELLELAR